MNQQRGLGEFGWGLISSTREVGVGLLLVEAWVFSVVAFACLPRHHDFWLFFVPYLLLVPPSGVLRASISGWKGFVVFLIVFTSASVVGLALHPSVSNWLLHAMLN
jgi:hypothetical protein